MEELGVGRDGQELFEALCHITPLPFHAKRLQEFLPREGLRLAAFGINDDVVETIGGNDGIAAVAHSQNIQLARPFVRSMKNYTLAGSRPVTAGNDIRVRVAIRRCVSDSVSHYSITPSIKLYFFASSTSRNFSCRSYNLVNSFFDSPVRSARMSLSVDCNRNISPCTSLCCPSVPTLMPCSSCSKNDVLRVAYRLVAACRMITPMLMQAPVPTM